MHDIDLSRTGRLGQELYAVPRNRPLVIEIDGKAFKGTASYTDDGETFVLRLDNPKPKPAKKKAKS